MSESLNQGWNEAITVLALRGLRGVCLGLCVISTPLLSLSLEREPGEKQQPGHSQSRQIVGVPGMQCKDTDWENDPLTHTCMAHFVAFVWASMNKCHFTLEDENFPCKRKQLQFNNLIQIWPWIRLQHLDSLCLFFFFFKCVSPSFYTEPRFYTSNKYWLNRWSTILWLGVLTSHHVVLCTACAAAELGQGLPSATIVLGSIC